MRKYILWMAVLFLFAGCAKQVETSVKIPIQTNVKEPSIYSNTVEKDGEKTLVIGGYEERTIPVISEQVQSTEQEKLKVKEKDKIAVVFASKIVGRYGNDAVNTIIAYTMYKNIDFEIKVYDSLYENPHNVEKAFNDASRDGFRNVIALFANDNSVEYISNINSFRKIYIPTLHKKQSRTYNANILYGAIDYEEQYSKLFESVNSRITEIYDTDKMSTLLSRYTSSKGIPISKKYQIVKAQTNYKSLFENNHILVDSSLFLNTTVLQSAIVLSQLRVYEVSPRVVLSTQLNYNPMILSLSQFGDRKNMLIANSIGKTHPKIQAIGAVLDSDFEYNWVNFSTLIGIKELLFQNDNDISGYKIADNQVKYDVAIYSPAEFSFIKLDR
ncbi:MAG: hypothetical protein AB1389_00290 [Campylobacterota bacterium]